MKAKFSNFRLQNRHSPVVLAAGLLFLLSSRPAKSNPPFEDKNEGERFPTPEITDVLKTAADYRADRSKGMALGEKSGLRMQACEGFYTCFYNPDSTLHHWVKEVVLQVPGGTDRRGNSRPVLYKPYFYTGGYAPIRKRQADYAQWHKTAWPSEPVNVEITGKLNVRTLNIPFYKMRHEAELLWPRFQAECRAAAGTRSFPVCGLSQSYRSDLGAGRDAAFPDPATKMLAALIGRCWNSLGRLESMGVVEPYNPGMTVGAGNVWSREAGDDHLEAELLPAGFMDRLSAAEAEAAEALGNVNLFLEAR